MPLCGALPLATARLDMRPLVPADAAALLAIHSHSEVMRYWSSPPWTALADAESEIALSAEHMASGHALRLAIVRREDDALIGQCTLFAIDTQNRRAEIGFALARAAWGQGLMTEALRALVTHGFGALDLHRIEADVDPRNARSMAALARLGFVQEGLLRERWIVAGEVSDSAMLGLLRTEWPA